MTRNGEQEGQLQRPFWRQYFFALLLGFLLIAVTTVLFPLSSLVTPLATQKVGDLASEDVIAPSTIPIKRTASEIESLRDSALQSVPLVFRYDQSKADSVILESRAFFEAMETMHARSTAWNDFLLSFPHLAVPPRIQDADSAVRQAASTGLDSVLAGIYRFGLMRNLLELPLSGSRTAAIVRGQSETLVRREHLLEVLQAQQMLRRGLREAVADTIMRPAFYELARQWLVPNLILDLSATERRKEMALHSIPVNKGVILKDEYIVRAGERITPRQLQGLQAMAESRLRAAQEGEAWRLLIPVTARVLFLAVLFAGFGVALRLSRPRIFEEGRSLSALAVLYLVQIILTYLIVYHWEVSGYLLPVTVATMLAAILLSVGVGVSFAVFLALVLGVVTGFDFAPVFLTVSVGTVSVMAVQNVRKRYHFYRPMAIIALAYVIVIALMEALRYTEPQSILVRAGYGVLNGILSPIITIGLLPLFETAFRLTTDITLIELSDMNHSLLRRLSVAAPGTYHHSIIVANLCEAAAESVRANPLLARVGAYFHDIGKMEKPEYFVENQMGRKNKHEELAPSMSALILAAHIKSGSEMARDARLPEVITDFIEQHHGTTRMTYFYRKAVEQAGHEIPDSDFRYPGPKPRTKETAILMLADSVEAVSRTLEDPRPNRLRSAIHQVITDKFVAGQLSDCPLTLKDLYRIEDAFLHLLLGAFHGRVRYPQQEDEDQRKKESILG